MDGMIVRRWAEGGTWKRWEGGGGIVGALESGVGSGRGSGSGGGVRELVGGLRG